MFINSTWFYPLGHPRQQANIHSSIYISPYYLLSDVVQLLTILYHLDISFHILISFFEADSVSFIGLVHDTKKR